MLDRTSATDAEMRTSRLNTVGCGTHDLGQRCAMTIGHDLHGLTRQGAWHENAVSGHAIALRPQGLDLCLLNHVARVSVLRDGYETNPAIPPTGDYHTAGIVARDPASVTGSENWIMYNTGHQNDQGATTGTEGKTTVNSVSTLTINQANHSGLLRLCRVGDEFYLLKNLDDESTWTQEHHYTRADLPNALQVGLITNAWPPGAAGEARNMQGRFDHFRVGTATSLADCTAAITPL